MLAVFLSSSCDDFLFEFQAKNYNLFTVKQAVIQAAACKTVETVVNCNSNVEMILIKSILSHCKFVKNEQKNGLIVIFYA